jgi:glycosyltransferase involved in cell wall biosynthesis
MNQMSQGPPDHLRILHAFPTFDLGGQQARVLALAEGLPGAWEHLVYATDGRYGAREHPGGRRFQPVFEELRLPHFPLAARARAKTLLQELQPDLVLTYNFGAIEVAWAAGNLGIPFVHHEDGFESGGKQPLRRDLLRRWVLRNAQAVIVPSAPLAQIARQRWKVHQSSLHLIKNGIRLPPPTSPEQRARARAALAVPQDALCLGTAGGLRPVKNHARLLRAFALLQEQGLPPKGDSHASPPLQLLIAGAGPLEQALHEQIARLGLENQCRLLGEQKGVSSLLQALDLFVLSSDSEQLPIVLLEAMAAGLPLVSTEVGDIRDTLSPENRPFVHPIQPPPGDAETLARDFARLLADPALREKIAAANRSRIQKAYSFEAMQKHYLRLYQHAKMSRP